MKKSDFKGRLWLLGCLCCAILLGATSCVLGKRYTRPELNLPETIGGYTDSLTMADMKWWTLYSDSTLQALIRKTLDYNKDMQIAVSRIKEMAARKRIDLANLLPQLSGTVGADREYEAYGGGSFSPDDEFGVKVRLNWEIDLWGNLRWARRKGIAEYLQTVEAQRALQMTLVADVAQAYCELVALDNELKIVRRTYATRKEAVHQAKLRFEGGLTSETSYQQAQVELASTSSLIPDLERRIALKESEIALLAGEYPTAVARGVMSSEPVWDGELPVGLPSELLKRRPDVQAAEQALMVANAKVGMAYTDRFPRLSLTGAFGVEDGKVTTLFESPYAFLAANLATPIFMAGKKQAQYRAEQAAYEQECYRYQKKVLTVFKEVNDAIISYNNLKESCKLKRNLERAAKSYVDLAQLQYINGVINYLDVLDAQRRYFDAQIGLGNAIRDEHIALVHLYKALGGGWEVDLPNLK